MTSDLTSLHAWLDRKDRIHYQVFDEDGTHVGGEHWENADRVIRELRAEFSDAFKTLGGRPRIEAFLLSLTRENATATNPARLFAHTSSVPIGTAQSAAQLDASGKAVIHDFQF